MMNKALLIAVLGIAISTGASAHQTSPTVATHLGWNDWSQLAIGVFYGTSAKMVSMT